MEKSRSEKSARQLNKSMYGISYGDLPIVSLGLIYMAGVFSVVSHHVFAAPGQVNPILIVGSVFVASFVIMFEIKTIVLPSYWVRGLQFLKLGGFSPTTAGASGTRIALAVCARLVMAAVFSMTTAVSVGAVIFEQDIAAWSQTQARLKNAHLVEAVTATIDEQIQRGKNALADESQRTKTLLGQVATLRRKSAHDALGKQSGQELAFLEATLATEDAKTERLNSALAALVASRPDAINRSVIASPDYAMPDKGLLHDIKALDALAHEDPHVRDFILAVGLIAMGLELALVISKLTDSAPSEFAGAWALSRCLSAARMVDDLMGEIEPESSGTTGRPPSCPAAANDNFAMPANDDFPMPDEIAAASQANEPPEPPPSSPPKRPRGRPRKGSVH